MSIVAFATSCGPVPAGTPSDFMPGFNRLAAPQVGDNQYTAIDQLAAPKMTPGLSEFT